ncbi:MAG TPA: flagellar hook-basal body complex protein FliE [Nitrospiraceae bacterium]|nr:flagellar hook-basal body complex protein FliE [Nitrospiraceae bacterium]
MDDMRITSSAPHFQEQAGADPTNHAGAGGQAGFLDSLKDAIVKTNEVQVEANHAVESYLTGETQNVHQTMVALQKADVSFQLMMQIRNKLVSAYEEIQRMQI